jgi:hypothetical protein
MSSLNTPIVRFEDQNPIFRALLEFLSTFLTTAYKNGFLLPIPNPQTQKELHYNKSLVLTQKIIDFCSKHKIDSKDFNYAIKTGNNSEIPKQALPELDKLKSEFIIHLDEEKENQTK